MDVASSAPPGAWQSFSGAKAWHGLAASLDVRGLRERSLEANLMAFCASLGDDAVPARGLAGRAAGSVRSR